jgi:hypothetical protein
MQAIKAENSGFEEQKCAQIPKNLLKPPHICFFLRTYGKATAMLQTGFLNGLQIFTNPLQAEKKNIE